MNPTASQQKHVSDIHAARRLGVSPQTLRRWRLKNEGPPVAKFGNAVRYDLDLLDQWAASRLMRREEGRG